MVKFQIIHKKLLFAVTYSGLFVFFIDLMTPAPDLEKIEQGRELTSLLKGSTRTDLANLRNKLKLKTLQIYNSEIDDERLLFLRQMATLKEL